MKKASTRHSAAEKLRKPVSRLLAACILATALLTIPNGFEDGWHEVLEMTGYSLIIFAGLGRVWCSLYIAGKKNRVLCVDGPYSITRNPLYFFSFVGVAGVFLALQSLMLTAIGCILFLFYYHHVMRGEERRLAALFGKPFDEYVGKVPRFLPKFSLYSSPQTEMVVSTRTVERGLREVFWFFAAIVMVEGLEAIHHKGALVFACLPG